MSGQAKRRLALAILAVASAAIGAILIAEHRRRASTPRFEIADPAVPYVREITLAPAEAAILGLPGGKDLAVWCEKAGSPILRSITGKLGMGYGEEPFVELERDENTREYLSYIRQGSVFDGGRGMPSEYILYINPYRISLNQLEIKSTMRLRVTVTHASEVELVSRKDEVDFHLGRLSSPDLDTQLESIRELESLVSCGSDYASPREKEIREALRPLSLNPDSEVAEPSAAALRELGDAETILRVMMPQPEGDFLTAREARVLGVCTKSCTDPDGLERIYQHALSFFESEDDQLRAFAASFFALTKPVPEARSALIEALHDSSPKVRAAAVRSLIYVLDEHEARNHLPAMVHDPDEAVVLAVLETSSYLGDTRKLDFALVEPFLNNPNSGIRAAAARAIEFERTAVSRHHLLKLSADADAGVRAAAAQALSGTSSRSARDRLVELLEDPDRMVRIRSLQGLLHGHHADAIPEIENLLARETDPDVIRIATDAIARLR